MLRDRISMCLISIIYRLGILHFKTIKENRYWNVYLLESLNSLERFIKHQTNCHSQEKIFYF